MLPLDQQSVQRAIDSGPAPLAELRRQGWEYFQKLDMPEEREELWRYIDLDFDIADFGLVAEPAMPLADDAEGVAAALGDLAGRATVVDGFVTAAEGSDVSVQSIAEADPARLEARYGTLVGPGLDKFAAAHAAFATDAVVVSAPRSTVATAPVFVDVQAVTDGAVTFPKVLIDAGEASEVSLVVEYRSPEDVAALTVPQIEAFLDPSAVVRLSVVQRWGARTVAISHGRLRLDRDANLRLAESGLGGSLARFHLTVDLEGRGSNAQVVGAYFGDGEQTLDYRYFMHHAGVNTSSDMFLKGAVEDEALSVFTGMIRIDEGAQRTDAFQTNRNLILSDGAAAQSVPNLEILANDVRCGHGSTMGPLDEEQRYYLMSRGLDRPRADRLQVRGFFEEALRKFPEASIIGPVREWINAKFVAAQREGRV